MNYLLTSRLAQHFRATNNEWQTVKELSERTGIPRTTVLNGLSGLRRREYLEQQGGSYRTRYRVQPDALFAPAPQRSPKPLSVPELTRRFCAKHGVSAPYEATQRSESALREWSRLTESRTA